MSQFKIPYFMEKWRNKSPNVTADFAHKILTLFFFCFLNLTEITIQDNSNEYKKGIFWAKIIIKNIINHINQVRRLVKEEYLVIIKEYFFSYFSIKT